MNEYDFAVYMIGSLDQALDEKDDPDLTIVCEADHLGQGVINDLIRMHLDAPKDQAITLYISCDGGSIRWGLAIQGVINIIRRDGRRVIGHVLGYAFSSAFDILQHCDYRIAEPEAGFMTHEEQSSKEGSTGSIGEDIQFSKKMEKVQYSLLSARTGRPVKFYTDKTKATDWLLTAKEALAEGVIDEIAVTPPLPKATHQPPQAAKRKRVKPNAALPSTNP